MSECIQPDAILSWCAWRPDDLTTSTQELSAPSPPLHAAFLEPAPRSHVRADVRRQISHRSHRIAFLPLAQGPSSVIRGLPASFLNFTLVWHSWNRLNQHCTLHLLTTSRPTKSLYFCAAADTFWPCPNCWCKSVLKASFINSIFANIISRWRNY